MGDVGIVGLLKLASLRRAERLLPDGKETRERRAFSAARKYNRGSREPPDSPRTRGRNSWARVEFGKRPDEPEEKPPRVAP